MQAIALVAGNPVLRKTLNVRLPDLVVGRHQAPWCSKRTMQPKHSWHTQHRHCDHHWNCHLDRFDAPCPDAAPII